MGKQERQERVVRLLNLLAYITKHPGSTVMEMARDLGLDPVQVRDDLDMLHLSGVGKHPGEMIDLEHDWMGVRIIDSQGLDKPLRLTPTEANALLLLLESLETMPGLVDSDAVTSAAAKIRAVTLGGGVDDARQAAAGEAAGVIAEALAARRQLELTYYSVTSDATTTRTVSPIDTFHHDGATYLRAWTGEELRIFRLDRIRGASLADAPSDAPAGIAFNPADPFGFSTRQAAQLLVRRDATWLADYWDIQLDTDALEDPGAAWIPATLRYGSGDWLVRFCLGQADRVRLISPSELADTVRHRVSGCLRALR